MMAEGINRNSTHFRIFTSHIVFGNESLNLVAHGVVDRPLASDRGPPRSFRTTTSFKQRATIVRSNATHLSRTLSSG